MIFTNALLTAAPLHGYCSNLHKFDPPNRNLRLLRMMRVIERAGLDDHQPMLFTIIFRSKVIAFQICDCWLLVFCSRQLSVISVLNTDGSTVMLDYILTEVLGFSPLG